MSPALGDSFPKDFKHNFAIENITIGNVIFCYSPRAKKEKRFVIVGINNEKSLVGVLLFNTEKPFRGDKNLEPLQIHFKAEDNPYLSWDSYLNCAHLEIIPYKILYDDLVHNAEHSFGPMEQKDFDRICSITANTKFISPKNVKNFGLTGYLLEL